jgi:hypothetical protein
MFRRQLDAHQLSFAVGEALAHLHKLWYDGILRRVTGDDGIIRFELANLGAFPSACVPQATFEVACAVCTPEFAQANVFFFL